MIPFFRIHRRNVFDRWSTVLPLSQRSRILYSSKYLCKLLPTCTEEQRRIRRKLLSFGRVNRDECFWTKTQIDGSSVRRASPDSSPKTRSAPPIPVISVNKSPSRGILSRVMSDSEKQKSHCSSSNASQQNRSSQSRMYRPEQYRSATFDSTNVSSDTNPQLSRSKETSSSENCLSFGHEYYLDNWTFPQIRSLLEKEIPPKGHFCLLIGTDDCDVQTLVEDQMNNSASFVWTIAPKDIRIELTKIFADVRSIFPSRTIRLRANDYLLLAIFCSRNECAYVRTRAGWTLIHDDVGQSHVIPEISDMIDGFFTTSRCQSEVCRHVLSNASFLYYKLVEWFSWRAQRIFGIFLQ